MEFEELKIKSAVELAEILSEMEAELHTLRLKAANKTLKQVRKIPVVRATIARIKMLLGNKKSAVK
ncbi:MAG: 50S ribosomal protein L29 [Candidatus Magasanikbacteria bacterium]|nr:50S ribosomal protein L29 [Candidatus Magasanikbacteria bacterium]